MESKMKRIEDIEKMGLEELEAAAMEEKVEVPQGLAGRIQERILAAELAYRECRPYEVQAVGKGC